MGHKLEVILLIHIQPPEPSSQLVKLSVLRSWSVVDIGLIALSDSNFRPVPVSFSLTFSHSLSVALFVILTKYKENAEPHAPRPSLKDFTLDYPLPPQAWRSVVGFGSCLIIIMGCCCWALCLSREWPMSHIATGCTHSHQIRTQRYRVCYRMECVSGITGPGFDAEPGKNGVTIVWL